ncbi:MAG: NAD(P)/FAD-dependent oxidoreductase [Oscillospiraceae bacterium]|nr:NAD(P)/FAD-dependent oxidoreductase [Oscillospiraceae bacterium]
MLPTIASDANFRYARTYRWEIEKWNVSVYPSTRCDAITEEGVCVTDETDQQQLLPADSVVIAAGMRPLSAEAEALRDCAPLFIPIGNCVRPGVIKDAIRTGFDAAMFQL